MLSMSDGTIGTRIAQARRAKKLSQDKLAKLIGVATMTVSRWETGALTPERENLRRLAEELEVEARILEYGPADAGEERRVEIDGDAPHPDVESYLQEHPETHASDAARLRAHFKRTALSEDVLRDIPSLLERAQLARLRGTAEKPPAPSGGKRTMADRDAEIRARKGK